MSGAGGGAARPLALLALLLVGATAALAQIWASAHLREAAQRTAKFERLYHASQDDAASWRDKHDAQAKARGAGGRRGREARAGAGAAALADAALGTATGAGERSRGRCCGAAQQRGASGEEG